MKIKKEKINNKNVRMYLAFYQWGWGGGANKVPFTCISDCVVKLIDLPLVKVKPDVLSLI